MPVLSRPFVRGPLARADGAREVVGLVLGGLAAAASHFVVFRQLVEENHMSWCGDGMEGLGCAFVSLFFVALAAVTIGAVLNWLVLRAVQVRVAGPTVFVATVAFVAWWLFLDTLLDGTNWAPLPLAVPPIVLNLLAAGLFRVVTPRRSSVAVVSALVVLASFPLYGQGNDFERKRSRDRRDDGIASASFVTYVPAWIPAGYELREVQFYDFRSTAPYASVDALHGNNDITAGDPAPFELTFFAVPDSFDPPRNCGTDKPYGTDYTRPCSEVATTARGETVYVDNLESFSSGQTFYVARGDTLITLRANSFGTALPVASILRILDGLHPYKP